MTARIAIAAAPARRRGAVRLLTPESFLGLTLAICLITQRIGIPYGEFQINLATPLVLGLSAWALASGVLILDRRRTGLFFALCAVTLIAVIFRLDAPVAFAPRSSINSLIYWLAVSSFAIVRLREPMDEERFFRLVNFWLGFIAAAGILQFFAQFAGLSLFSFRHIVPDHFLLEDQFNVVIPFNGDMRSSGFILTRTGWRCDGCFGTFKSNGFFLVEPSTFSQLMALGLIIEWLYFRRPAWFALLMTGLFCSVSGTGWMILGAFLLQSIASFRRREVLWVLGFVIACAIGIAIASLLLPEVTASLLSRTDEFSRAGTSGYDRFITPWMAASQVLARAPWSFFTGIGPGTAEWLNLPLPPLYTVNPPIKILIEYGVFALALYLALLLTAYRTPRQKKLVLPLLVLLLFAGGYLQFTPGLYPALLVLSVAYLRESRAVPRTARKGSVAFPSPA